jgi:hypothetical protein
VGRRARHGAGEQGSQGIQGGHRFPVQPCYVQALIPDQDQDRAAANGVDGHVAADASGHGLAQRALPGFLGHALREG